MGGDEKFAEYWLEYNHVENNEVDTLFNKAGHFRTMSTNPNRMLNVS